MDLQKIVDQKGGNGSSSMTAHKNSRPRGGESNVDSSLTLKGKSQVT
jgi:hypothetical protein